MIVFVDHFMHQLWKLFSLTIFELATTQFSLMIFFFYQNVSVLKDQKIYITSEPASSNTRADIKGTGSLNVQYSKADNGYERNQKLQGSQPNTKQETQE